MPDSLDAPAPRRGGPRRRVPSLGTVHDRDEGTRHATWLELFFDLVVVAAVAALGGLLHHDPTAGGVATFAGLFVPVWWAWISFSYFADLFDDDGTAHRTAQLVGMLGMAVLAILLADGVGGDGAVFALVYAALFALLAVMYFVVGRTEPRAAELCRWYTAGSGVGAALWLVSAAVPAPGRYVVWGVALLVNALVSGPVAYAFMRRPPAQVSHMPERFGLFTIVVLGETVLSVVRGIDATDWAPAATVTAVAGFATACGIWWVYFDGFDEAGINRAIAGGRAAQVRSFLYGYGHLLVYAAIVAVGVGVEIAAEHAAHGDDAPPLLGSAVAVLIAAFFVITRGTGQPVVRSALLVKVVLAVGAVVVCSVGLPAPVAAVAIGAGWLALVAWELRPGVAAQLAAARDALEHAEVRQ